MASKNTKKQISIIATSFHQKQVSIMLEEAKRVCRENKITVANEIWVPGSLETPLALQKELLKKNITGAVVLGIIEQGETKHGLVMGIAVISAILKIQLKLQKPIGVGILGPEIMPEQIHSRLLPYSKDAVLAVHSMLK